MAKQVISIDALQPGMVILAITQQNGPVKIRKSGLVSSQEMVQGLAEMGVLEVEIDPAQSVEIEEASSSASVPSPTQTLLKKTSNPNQSIDHSLADQFNRSLFLPSVQSLPSIWQHYGKRAISLFGVVVLGGSVGWLSATHEKWLSPLLTSNMTSIGSAKVVSTEASEGANLQSISDVSARPQPDTSIQTNAKAAVQGQNAAPSNSLQQAQSAAEAAVPPSSNTLGAIARVNPNSTSAATSEANVNEPKVLGYVPEQQTANAISAQSERAQFGQSGQSVSEDLLEKFRQAVADLENTPVDLPEQNDKPADLMRIDQLPDQVLSRLPNMAFSAHMYDELPDARWVRVNGRQRFEGEWIDEQIRIVRIEPQYLVLDFEGREFSMGALTDW